MLQVASEMFLANFYCSSGDSTERSTELKFSGLYSYHVPTSTWRLLRADSPELRSRIGHSMLFHPVCFLWCKDAYVCARIECVRVLGSVQIEGVTWRVSLRVTFRLSRYNAFLWSYSHWTAQTSNELITDANLLAHCEWTWEPHFD